MKNEKGGHMKELDFDELHDAVNKLMVQAQKPKAKSVAKAVSRPSVKVAERPAGKAAAPQREKPAPANEGSSAVNITVRKAVKVLPKKRGMAMDVIQSAKPTAIKPPSARAARTAPTLHPTGPVAPEPPSQPEPAAATSPRPASSDVSDDTLASLNLQTDGTARPKTVVDEEHKKVAESAFPDPLDVHGFSEGEQASAPQPGTAEPERPAVMEHEAPVIAQVPQTPITPEAAAEPGTDTQEPEPQAPAEPAATPFVNAKVEKRPLGAYASAAPPAPVPPAKPEDATPPAPGSKLEPAAIETPVAPAELRPEIVAVESGEADYSQPKDAESLDDLRHMAIPQQYQAHDKQADHHDRPVFDTKDYHPPIQPVAGAKKHGGSKAGAWLTFILIILLIAAGVAAYFVATGGIDITRLF